MSQLNSKFDFHGRDPHAAAQAGLTTVLAVHGAPGPWGTPGSSGTPVAGTIVAGTIVVMNTSGKAIKADNADASTNAPQMFYITVDGDADLDGAFVHRLTCIQGGSEFILDPANFVADSYLPGDALSCASSADAGKFRKATSGEQIYGFVGSEGYNATDLTLHIIIPQGISPAKP